MRDGWVVGGLFCGACAAAVGAVAVANFGYHQRDWVAIPLLAMGYWGAYSVSVLWARCRRYERMLLKHGLLPQPGPGGGVE